MVVWPRLSVCVLAACLVTVAGRAGDNKPRVIEGWGRVTDLDGDCVVKGEKGKLAVTIPGTLHDLSPRNGRLNAPRVLQDVEGDFTVRVRVGGEFRPGRNKASPNSLPFVSAGLLVWADEKNYLRLVRNAWYRLDLGRHACYVPLVEYCKDGTYQSADPPATFFQEELKGDSTYLRLERKGDKVSLAYSRDGKEWVAVKELTVALPRKVSVGVLASNNSDRPLKVEFDEFSLGAR